MFWLTVQQELDIVLPRYLLQWHLHQPLQSPRPGPTN